MMQTIEAQHRATIGQATEAFNNLDRVGFNACYADPCLFHFLPDGNDRTIGREEQWEMVLGIVSETPGGPGR